MFLSRLLVILNQTSSLSFKKLGNFFAESCVFFVFQVNANVVVKSMIFTYFKFIEFTTSVFSSLLFLMENSSITLFKGKSSEKKF